MSKHVCESRHIVNLPIDTTAYENQLMEKHFHAISHIHNVMVKHAQKLIVQLDHNKQYQNLRSDYIRFLKAHKDAKLSKNELTYKKSLSDQMQAIRFQLGLTEYSFQAYIKVCAKAYNHLLSSQQVQKEATHVWKSVEQYLFGDGKTIHFKKYMNFDTIGGKSNTNGVKFDKKTFTAQWMNHTYTVRRPKRKSMDYVYEALDSDICYCDVRRRMFPNGWHYYLIVVLKGPAPKKLIPGDHLCGIDPGVSTIAAVSDDHAYLEELAPYAAKYNAKIVELQYHMDLSRRQNNPDKYNADGTIKKGDRTKWNDSASYNRMYRKLKYLYAAKSAYIKQSHNMLINRLLTDSKYFVVEAMDYKALAKRSKKTERTDKISAVPTKDSSTRTIHKYKRKKRFGKSLNNRAPAAFIRLLEQKAALYGGSVVRVNTKEYRASQYNHCTDAYTKVPLSQRYKVVDGYIVQRDLYSAFLIRNTDTTLTHPDRGMCTATFETFVNMHDALIRTMKEQHISMKQCFGF